MNYPVQIWKIGKCVGAIVLSEEDYQQICCHPFRSAGLILSESQCQQFHLNLQDEITLLSDDDSNISDTDVTALES